MLIAQLLCVNSKDRPDNVTWNRTRFETLESSWIRTVFLHDIYVFRGIFLNSSTVFVFFFLLIMCWYRKLSSVSALVQASLFPILFLLCTSFTWRRHDEMGEREKAAPLSSEAIFRQLQTHSHASLSPSIRLKKQTQTSKTCWLYIPLYYITAI